MIILKEVRLSKPYSFGAYNKVSETEQWVRLSEGCPNQCPYCAEPKEERIFGIPDIKRTDVKILDMNLLAKSEALTIIERLGLRKVGNSIIHYELTCGIDYRFLTQKLANALKNAHFVNPRIAWDWGLDQQARVKNAIKMLKEAGYHSKEIMIFMVCNWKIPYEANLKKLDLLKVWNVQVADCYFDNQTSPNFKPIYWTIEQMREFRSKCREHNQIVNFEIFPEIKSMPSDQSKLFSATDKLK